MDEEEERKEDSDDFCHCREDYQNTDERWLSNQGLNMLGAAATQDVGPVPRVMQKIGNIDAQHYRTSDGAGQKESVTSCTMTSQSTGAGEQQCFILQGTTDEHGAAVPHEPSVGQDTARKREYNMSDSLRTCCKSEDLIWMVDIACTLSWHHGRHSGAL